MAEIHAAARTVEFLAQYIILSSVRFDKVRQGIIQKLGMLDVLKLDLVIRVHLGNKDQGSRMEQYLLQESPPHLHVRDPVKSGLIGNRTEQSLVDKDLSAFDGIAGQSDGEPADVLPVMPLELRDDAAFSFCFFAQFLSEFFHLFLI